MILIVTNREDITADFVVLELKKRKEAFIRFNTEDFPEKVKVEAYFKKEKLQGQFMFVESNRTVPFSLIKSVWYRRPTLPIFKNIKPMYRKFCIQESVTLLNGIWGALDAFWLSKPKNIYFAENKVNQLVAASRIGLLIPPTLISNDYDKIRSFFEKQSRDIIIKPIKNGMLDEKSIVFTNSVDSKDLASFRKSAPLPSTYQKNIKKELDIRLTVIGKKVFATEIHSQDNKNAIIDWRRAQDINLLHRKHKIPDDVKKKCVSLVRELGLQFGAIDMILSKNGKYYFLEINPNGQWGWIEKKTGYRLTEAIVDLLMKGDNKDGNI
jgi:hypothetical protein